MSPKIKTGDTIAIVAPGSAPVEDQKLVKRAAAILRSKGYKVKIAPNLFTPNGYLAGSDAARAKAFMDLWLDPEVKALWCYRGGFGCTRILDRLDYQKIKGRPKILIGMSDITALHMAINKECGIVTFLGPNLNAVYGQEQNSDNDFNEKALWKMIAGKSNVNGTKTFSENATIIHGGVARGRLAGGNLSIVCALIGTPWENDFAGSILLLEEVGEEPYRIDRMLRQLKQTGALDHLAGLILCSWHDCQSKGEPCSLETLFREYFGHAKYPVLLGFPSGHIKNQETFPLGLEAELDTSKKTLTILP